MIIYKKNIMVFIQKRKFFALAQGKSSNYRIGPHNIDFLSFILGGILGGVHLEKRKQGFGTRIIFEQCQQNIEYLCWINDFLIKRGYCKDQKPFFKKRITKQNKIFFHFRINTYTFTSLNWLIELFYNNKKKIIPIEHNIWNYFNEQSLAVWFMDDGSKTKSGYKLATNCFEIDEIKFLQKLLLSKFNLKTTMQSSGVNKGYIIYIKSESKQLFKNLVENYMHNSMKYKLVKPVNIVMLNK